MEGFSRDPDSYKVELSEQAQLLQNDKIKSDGCASVPEAGVVKDGLMKMHRWPDEQQTNGVTTCTANVCESESRRDIGKEYDNGLAQKIRKRQAHYTKRLRNRM